MKTHAFSAAIALASFSAQAKEYLCTYKFTDIPSSTSMLLEVADGKAIARGSTDLAFTVAVDSDTELLLYMPRTARDNPFYTIVIDKKTLRFVYTYNFFKTHASDDNLHANGTCEVLRAHTER